MKGHIRDEIDDLRQEYDLKDVEPRRVGSARLHKTAGIEATPGVCGGAACIVRTRIPVWILERARQWGTSEAEILRGYPNLRAEDLANAWAYRRSHRDEVDREIAENEATNTV